MKYIIIGLFGENSEINIFKNVGTTYSEFRENGKQIKFESIITSSIVMIEKMCKIF